MIAYTLCHVGLSVFRTMRPFWEKFYLSFMAIRSLFEQCKPKLNYSTNFGVAPIPPLVSSRQHRHFSGNFEDENLWTDNSDF